MIGILEPKREQPSIDSLLAELVDNQIPDLIGINKGKDKIFESEFIKFAKEKNLRYTSFFIDELDEIIKLFEALAKEVITKCEITVKKTRVV